jgi:hypothetical protein
MESWAGIYSIGVHPGAGLNCLNLRPHGIMATHRQALKKLPKTEPDMMKKPYQSKMKVAKLISSEDMRMHFSGVLPGIQNACITLLRARARNTISPQVKLVPRPGAGP